MAERKVITATPYTDVSVFARARIQRASVPARPVASRRARGKGIVQILVRNKPKGMSLAEWVMVARKPGGFLDRYFEREKHLSPQRQRAVARLFHDEQPNLKSDLRVVGRVPMLEYLRWKAVDPHFFEDNGNLRSLKRDNPDMASLIKV